MPFPILRKKSGFNLLEVVIASFIFSTVSIAFLGVWGMQARAMEKSRHSLVGTKFAEELVEDSMEKGYERMPVTIDRDDPSDVDDPVIRNFDATFESRNQQGEWVEFPVEYRSSVSVEEFGGADDQMKMVTVTVNWDDSTKRGEVVLVTYLAGVL